MATDKQTLIRLLIIDLMEELLEISRSRGSFELLVALALYNNMNLIHTKELLPVE